MDFKSINKAVLAAYPGILFSWLPGGKQVGNEYQCGDLSGGKGSSLSINVKTGMWADFATGDSGGDAISLYAAINRLEQGAAAIELSKSFGASDNNESQKTQQVNFDVIQPAPKPATESQFLHFKFGKPSNVWTYYNIKNELMGYVCRFNLENGDKETWPLVYTNKGWKWKSFNKPRSLYNEQLLAKAKPDSQIFIVEGEKCADALLKYLPNAIVLTWPGGGKALHLANWKLIAGYEVIIWPDRDRKKFQGNHPKAGQEMPYTEQPGTQSALKLAETLQTLGCKIRIVNVSKMDVVDGWDVADAAAENWSKQKIVSWIKENIETYAPAVNEVQSNVVSMAATRIHPTSQIQPKPKGKSANVVTITENKIYTGDEAWRNLLCMKDLTRPVTKSVNNAKVFLEHHPDMRGVFWLNLFTRNIEMRRCPMWKNAKTFKPGPLQDSDDVEAKMWLERYATLDGAANGGITISISETRAAISAVAAVNQYNPLQEWLNSIVWDKKPRLENWLHNYMGAENNDYTKVVGKKFMVGAVARALNPGCKMDTMLILEGEQGLRKSTAIEVLFSEEYFTDEIQGVGSKDTAMQMLGRWVIEVAELDALERAEVKTIKAWMSRKTDKFRPPYGRSVIEQPRSCVLFGTVNPEGLGYLRDATGGRRFWPTKCGQINIELLKQDREQLWAEAVMMFKAGEQWWLAENEVKLAEAQQEDRYENDPWADDINKYLQAKYVVTTNDIMNDCLEISKERKTRAVEMRIGKHLASTGWTRRKVRVDGELKWRYERPKTQETLNFDLHEEVPF